MRSVQYQLGPQHVWYLNRVIHYRSIQTEISAGQTKRIPLLSQMELIDPKL